MGRGLWQRLRLSRHVRVQNQINHTTPEKLDCSWFFGFLDGITSENETYILHFAVSSSSLVLIAPLIPQPQKYWMALTPTTSFVYLTACPSTTPVSIVYHTAPRDRLLWLPPPLLLSLATPALPAAGALPP
jgi:hypothetical protein